jgi:hypothetical protein
MQGKIRILIQRRYNVGLLPFFSPTAIISALARQTEEVLTIECDKESTNAIICSNLQVQDCLASLRSLETPMASWIEDNSP